MVEVINIKICKDWGKEGDIYIGRGSPWGNPYKMKNGSDGERERVIELYAQYTIPTLDIEPLLKAKRLGCYCKPKSCHGDILKDRIELKLEIRGVLYELS